MSLVRVLRTAAATLSRTLYVDETLTAASGPVTVAVTRPDGTLVTSGTASTASTGVYTYVLPGGPTSPTSATWQLDLLTVTWSATLAGAAVTLTDKVEVVGGFLFGLAEARASDSALANTAKYPTADLAAKRLEVEEECERLTGRSFVPRFRRVTLPPPLRPQLLLPDVDIRVLRAVSTVANPGGVTTPLSLSSDVSVSPGGVLSWYGGYDAWPQAYWPASSLSMVVEYEYGMDYPPSGVARAGMYRLRSLLNLTRSGVPDRVSSYTTPDGSTFRVTVPTRGSTGIPEVDGPYGRYEAPVFGFA